MLHSISSDQNPVFRTLRECLQTKGIKKHGLFILSGEKVVQETIKQYPEQIRNLILPSEFYDTSTLLEGDRDGFSTLSLTPKLFDELDIFGTHYPLLVLKVPDIEKADLTRAPEGLEVLCALGDPSNLGAMIRSAAAFGVHRIILLKESATPFHPKAVRAASATTVMMKFSKGPSIHELETSSVFGPVVALDMEGEPLNSFLWPENVRLLIGEEGPGVPASSGFKRLMIPMQKGVESLNASVATGIALYTYRVRKQ